MMNARAQQELDDDEEEGSPEGMGNEMAMPDEDDDEGVDGEGDEGEGDEGEGDEGEGNDEEMMLNEE
jgi:hypothetical protein